MHRIESLDLFLYFLEVALRDLWECYFAKELLDFYLIWDCVDLDFFGFESSHCLHNWDDDLLSCCQWKLSLKI